MRPPQLLPHRPRQIRIGLGNPQLAVAMHAADIDIGRAEQGIEVIHQQQLGVHVDVLVARLQRRRPEGGLGFGGQARWRRAAGAGSLVARVATTTLRPGTSAS